MGASEVGDHRGAVPRVLQARGARLRAAAGVRAHQGGRPPGIHAAPLPAQAGAIRSLESRASPRHQALRPPRVHHGRRRAVDAAVSPLRARRHRFERSAAQCVARDPAAVARRRGHPDDIRQARARPARGSRRQSGRQVRDVLERIRPRAQRGRRRRLRQPGPHREAAPILIDARARPRNRPSRSPTTSGG